MKITMLFFLIQVSETTQVLIHIQVCELAWTVIMNRWQDHQERGMKRPALEGSSIYKDVDI